MQYHQRPDQVGLAANAAALKCALLGARQGATAKLPDDVHALRRDISTGAARPCVHLLRVALTDIAHGVALDRVLHVARVFTAIVTTAARVRDGVPVPTVDAALDLEMPVDLELDAIQWRVRAGDHSRPAIASLAAACRVHRDRLDSIIAASEHALYAEGAA